MAENIEEDLKRTAEEFTGPPGSITRAMVAPLARYWWIELILGVFWLIVAAVVLKFNHASVVTVGVLTGIMFLIFAAEEFALAIIDRSAGKWLWGFFGVLLLAGGVWSDRLPRHLVLVSTDGVRGAAQAVTAALLVTGSASVLGSVAGAQDKP